MSLIGDERVVSLQRTQVYIFSDSVLCLGKMHENPLSNTAWEQRLEWFKSTSEYRNLDRIDGGPMEFEWNIFSGFNTLQLSQEVKDLLCSWPERRDVEFSLFVCIGVVDRKTPLRPHTLQSSCFESKGGDVDLWPDVST